jgi:hypothetical protein
VDTADAEPAVTFDERFETRSHDRILIRYGDLYFTGHQRHDP